MKRPPAVAGQFYEASSSELTSQVDQYIDTGVKKEDVIGLVSPHAGLMYSGSVAGAVYSRINIPHTIILLGPNHTGLGSPLSMMVEGAWHMPTGDLSIDEELAEKLLSCADVSGVISNDATAHQMEHSLEVQLPFILRFSTDVKILPITMMPASIDTCKLVGEAIADVIKEADYPVVIAASSDMSHYVSDETARKKDSAAIDNIVSLNPEGLYDTVRDKNISMCGVIPVTTMLYAAVRAGGQQAYLVKYMTSGDVSGDFDYVVGYAGLIVK